MQIQISEIHTNIAKDAVHMDSPLLHLERIIIVQSSFQRADTSYRS